MTCSISFAGCGFLMSYHVGVAMCLLKYAPEMILGKICSTSSGLLIAVSLICDIPLGVIFTEILRITNIARSFTLGPLDPRFNLHKCLEEVLRNHLPEDAHKRASGRLFISLTRIHDKSNVVLSEFRYREQLIKAILAGSFIPTYSGFLPKPYRGVRYIDGSVTNNLPVIDGSTIRVSPFSGEADICPNSAAEASCSHANIVNMVVDVTEENLHRFLRVFIPKEPAAMIQLCEQGFDDALRYLQCNKRNVLVKSFFITSTFVFVGNDERGTDLPSSSTNAVPFRIKDASIDTLRIKENEAKSIVDPTGKAEDKDSFDSDSAELKPSEYVLKKLNISSNVADNRETGNLYNTRTIRPIGSIKANLMSCTAQSVECRSFQMRLPKHDPPPSSRSTGGQVTAYFKEYLFLPVTQLLSNKIFEASRVVLTKVNKRVNVEILMELLVKRPDQSSSANDIKLLKHFLQMTNEHTPIETIYYIDQSNKIHVTELFDFSESEDTNLQTDGERELNQLLEFDIDDWGDAELVGNQEDREWEDDDLFSIEGDGKEPDSSLVHSKESTDQFEYNGPDGDEGTEYSFSDIASKALNIQQEYNTMIFETFKSEANDAEDEKHNEGS